MKKSWVGSLLYFLCALMWAYVAYESYSENNFDVPYLQIVLMIGFGILAVLKFIQWRK